MRIALPLLFLCIVLACGGCGQKGPLYLPDPAQAQQPTTPEEPADR